MRPLALATILLLLASTTPGAHAGEVRLNGRTFTLPEGFTIEVAAAAPLVERPIVADFDEEGFLYVADSSGSNDPVQKQLATKPHRIVRLEDKDHDGRFDHSTVFADQMMFPAGAMWYEGSLYVSAPPSIWKLTDTDGDGVADQRVEWFQGKTLTGCANDLHGPYLGLDGWIYWCKGAFAEQTYERPGRPAFVTRAAHIFRRRPSGGEIEPVMTGGMDNPVDVVFTPGGERIFTTTFLQNPGGGLRDGLIHAVYGGVWGKVHNVIDGHKRTSPDLMPVLAHLGPAAPCGLTRYKSDVFGPNYRDNLFATLFNLHKVTRHVLKPEGATFSATIEDFLVASDLDFHPTDIQDDADGSLLVLDTGGWYKLCCPTSQLVKPDVLGAIYRIRKKDAPRIDDPRGLRIMWPARTNQEVAERLDDPRPAVRDQAIRTLMRRREYAVSVLDDVISTSRSPLARQNAVWTATQIDGERARAAVRHALEDRDETVRQAAIHSVSVWRDAGSESKLIALLERTSAHNRRAAAEALGRISYKMAVPALLAAVGQPCDPVLEHSLIYALIEINAPRTTYVGTESDNVRTRRAALIAVDQMEGGRLVPERVANRLASPEPSIKEAAAWILSRHPEWGDALAGFLHERLDTKGLSAAERVELERQLAQFTRAKAVRDLIAARLNDPSAPRDTRLSVLRAMAQASLTETPPDWVAGLDKVLAGQENDLIRQAVTAARALPVKPKSPAADTLATRLVAVGEDKQEPAAVRLEALGAVPGGLPKVSPALFKFLVEELDPEKPVNTRLSVADTLSRAKLTGDQLRELVAVVKTAGPLEIDRLLTAFEQSKDPALGRALIASLNQSPARATLRVDSLRPRLGKFGPDVENDAESLYSAINADNAQQRTKLETLASSLNGGDIRRGQTVFNSSKAACSSCHAIGYLGGRVGPDLTRIGQIRSERDLLESIVFPSASFVRSYEPLTVATKGGKVVNGIPRKLDESEIVLTTGPTEEARIARDDIDEVRPGVVSVMPAGLDQQLSRQDLADLVAFLRACK